MARFPGSSLLEVALSPPLLCLLLRPLLLHSFTRVPTKRRILLGVDVHEAAFAPVQKG